MSKLLGAVLVTCFATTCALPLDDQGQELPDSSVLKDAATPVPTRSAEDLEEERRMLAETPQIEALLKAGLPLPGEQNYVSLSAYQRQLEESRLGGKASGALLSRMTVSEGTSLMPLRSSWKRDKQGILQVVRNNQKPSESLYAALGRHSPHVARINEYTRPRQRWTSTLPAEGDEAPEYWEECTSWYMDKRDRRRGLPKGCNGVWVNGVEAWRTIRAYGIKLVKMTNPPEPVQGNPKAWGGIMDVARFLEKRPNMCWLESGDTRNNFFGLKSDPENECKEVPQEMLERSRIISVKIMKRDIKRRLLERALHAQTSQ